MGGSFLDGVRLYDDLPVEREDDLVVDFLPLVKFVAKTICTSPGPMTLAVTGGWGSGKSTFCRVLKGYLDHHPRVDDAGQSKAQALGVERAHPDGADDKAVEKAQARRIRSYLLVASEFAEDAERAILFGIAMAVTDGDQVESQEVVRQFLPANGRHGSPAWSVTALRQFQGWVRARLGDAGTGAVRSGPPGSSDGPIGKVLVIVDDLDRCTAENAADVLNAVRRYVACPEICFLLAADREVLLCALREARPDRPELARHIALEKYIRQEFELPQLGKTGDSTDARKDINKLRRTVKLEVIRADPRCILDFKECLFLDGTAAAALDELLVKSFDRGLTIRTFKRIMNDVMVALAEELDGRRKAADEAMAEGERRRSVPNREYLDPEAFDFFVDRVSFTLAPKLFEPDHSRHDKAGLSFGEWSALLLETLLRKTCRHVFPAMEDLLDHDLHEFRRLLAVMATTAEEGVAFDERTQRQVIAGVLGVEEKRLPPPHLLAGLSSLAWRINFLTRKQAGAQVQEMYIERPREKLEEFASDDAKEKYVEALKAAPPPREQRRAESPPRAEGARATAESAGGGAPPLEEPSATGGAAPSRRPAFPAASLRRMPPGMSKLGADIWNQMKDMLLAGPAPDRERLRQVMTTVDILDKQLSDDELVAIFHLSRELLTRYVDEDVAINAGNFAVTLESRRLHDHAYEIYRLFRKTGLFRPSPDDHDHTAFKLASQYISFLQDTRYDCSWDEEIEGRGWKEESQACLNSFESYKELLPADLRQRYERLSVLQVGDVEGYLRQAIPKAAPDSLTVEGAGLFFLLMKQARLDGPVLRALVKEVWDRTAKSNDVVDRVRRFAGDLLVEANDINNERAGAWFLLTLRERGAPTWDFAARHNVATILYKHDRCLGTAFALWSEALRDQPQDTKIRRAFAQFLERSGLRAEAVAVLLKGEAPPASAWPRDAGADPLSDPYYADMDIAREGNPNWPRLEDIPPHGAPETDYGGPEEVD